MKKISHALLILALCGSCVSKKIYNELQSKYDDLLKLINDDNSFLYKLNIIIYSNPSISSFQLFN